MSVKKTALMLAMLMAATFSSCGKDDISESSSVDSAAVSSESLIEDSVSDSESESQSVSKSEKTAERDSAETKAISTKSKEKSTTVSGSKSKSGGNSVKNDSKTTAEKNSSSGKGGNSAAETKPDAQPKNSAETKPTAAEPEKSTETTVSEYTAEITFSETASVIGSNAESDGSQVRITAGGDYIIRGSTADGQIYVNTATEEKVTLILDGVDISCSGGPAIFIDEAKKCTVKLTEGSVNNLSDGGRDKINDGVIFSNDTVRIKGNGTLNITANNEHGISSDDDIIIESGFYNIRSKKSGILANDDITINGGELHIFGGTNGIKSKGTVNINGGISYISGGVKEEKSSVYAAAGFYYGGGSVFAAGNTVTAPSSAPNPYIVVNFVNGAAGGSTAGLVLNGMEYASVTGENPFRCVLMLSPDITVGSAFVPYLDGVPYSEFIVSDGQNVFSVE